MTKRDLLSIMAAIVYPSIPPTEDEMSNQWRIDYSVSIAHSLYDEAKDWE